MLMHKETSRSYFPFKKIIFYYFIACLMIIIFNFDEYQIVQYLINFATSTIPSISPTAAISIAPRKAELVLAISWLLVVVVAFKLVVFVRWDQIDFERFYKSHPLWLSLLVNLACIGLIMLMAWYTPLDSGRYQKFIYDNLKESIYFVAFYGLSIWILFSSVILFTVFNLIYLYQKLAGKNKHES